MIEHQWLWKVLNRWAWVNLIRLHILSVDKTIACCPRDSQGERLSVSEMSQIWKEMPAGYRNLPAGVNGKSMVIRNVWAQMQTIWQHVKCKIPKDLLAKALPEWRTAKTEKQKTNKQTNEKQIPKPTKTYRSQNIKASRIKHINQSSGGMNTTQPRPTWKWKPLPCAAIKEKRDRADFWKGGSLQRKLCFKPQICLIEKNKYSCHQ